MLDFRHARNVAGMLVILALVNACATPAQTLGIRQQAPAIAPRHELVSTPFYPQQKYLCGPAALAALIEYRGAAVTPAELIPLVYVPGREGAFQEEVIAATRQYDLLPVKLDRKLTSLLREIAAGNPVLVLQNLGFDFFPRWHYAIAVGYDLERDVIILRSGTNRRLERPLSVFERTWQRADFWSLAIVTPGAIPVSTGAPAYVQSAIEFEQTAGLEAAQRNYRAAAQRWPTNLLAQVGLGNTSYAVGDFRLAASAYRAALEIAPLTAEVWNNLAYALMQLGDSENSLAAVTRALQLAPQDTNYQNSLKELSQGIKQGE